MKNLFLLFFLFFLMGLYSCSNPYHSKLLLADSLMDVRPDSVLAKLTGLKDSIQNERKSTRMAFYLLLTKAQDKCFVEHTTDSIMKLVVDYYQRYGTPAQEMEALYYLASVYRDLGDAPRAIDYFQQAADASKKKTEHELLGRIYSQMGTLFFYQGLPEEGMRAYRKSYNHMLLANDSLRLIFGCTTMARVHTELGNVDSTLYYYNEAVSRAKKIGNAELEKDINLEMADIYIQLNKIEKAQSLLISNPQKGTEYLNWGDLYLKKLLPDSARYFYLKAQDTGNLYIKRSANWGLYSIAKAHGRNEETIFFLEKYNLYNDSIQEITDMDGVKRIESLYAYQHIANENNRLLLENKRKERIIYLGSLLFLIITWYFYYRWKKMKEQKDHINRLNYAKKQEYHQKIIKYNEEIDFLKQQLSMISINSDQEKTLLQMKLDKTLEEQNRIILSRQEAESAFRCTHIYQRFHSIGKKNKVEINDEHWIELQNEIDKTYNDFTSRLYLLYPRLKQRELQVCLLVKAGIANSDIATLINLEENSVSSIRARLYQKIHNKRGKSKDFDKFIIGL